MKRLLGLFFMASSMLFTAANAQAMGGSSSTGLGGNPASLFCVNNGQLFGQEMCRVDVNAVVGAWSLFRAADGGIIDDAIEAFINHQPFQQNPQNSSVHPVVQYCSQVGGVAGYFQGPGGYKYGKCTFNDQSEIEIWTLFRGPNAPGARKLAMLLGRCGNDL